MKRNKYEGWSFDYEYDYFTLDTYPYTRAKKLWVIYYYGKPITTAERKSDIKTRIAESGVGGFLNLVPTKKGGRAVPELPLPDNHRNTLD